MRTNVVYRGPDTVWEGGLKNTGSQSTLAGVENAPYKILLIPSWWCCFCREAMSLLGHGALLEEVCQSMCFGSWESYPTSDSLSLFPMSVPERLGLSDSRICHLACCMLIGCRAVMDTYRFRTTSQINAFSYEVLLVMMFCYSIRQ